METLVNSGVGFIAVACHGAINSSGHTSEYRPLMYSGGEATAPLIAAGRWYELNIANFLNVISGLLSKPTSRRESVAVEILEQYFHF